MKIVKKIFEKITSSITPKRVSVAIGTVYAGLATTNAMAIDLPMGKFFCDVASALQSQWAPGIILIVFVVEGLLFLVVKKGILQMLMVTVVAATIVFSGGSLLNMIKPNSACSATALLEAPAIPEALTTVEKTA